MAPARRRRWFVGAAAAAFALAPALVLAGPAQHAAAATIDPQVRLTSPGWESRVYAGTDWDNALDVRARDNLAAKQYARSQYALSRALSGGKVAAGTVIEGSIVPSTQGPQTVSGTVVRQGASKASSAVRFGGVVSKLGAVGAGVTGLQLGWAVGSEVAGLFGLDTQGAMCQLLPSGSTCGDGSGVLPAPAYTPPAGQANTASGSYTWDRQYYYGTRGTVTATVTYSGTKWSTPCSYSGGTPPQSGCIYIGNSYDPAIAETVWDGELSWIVDYTYPTGSGNGADYDVGVQPGWTCTDPSDGVSWPARIAVDGGTYTRTEKPNGTGFVIQGALTRGLNYALACTGKPGDSRSGGYYQRAVVTEVGLNIVGRGGQSQSVVVERSAPIAVAEPPTVGKLVTQLVCQDGTSVEAVGASFSTTDASWGLPPSASCTGHGRPVSGQVLLRAGGQEEVLSDWTESAERTATLTQYPECATAACTLDLRRVTATGTVSCFDYSTACQGWSTYADRETQFQCWYGSHRVDLSRCLVYREAFEPDVARLPLIETDPTPTLAPPTAGPAPAPDLTPTPGQGGQPSPGDAESSECWPSGWGMFNPAEWVLRPVGCALAAAFVPSPEALAQARADLEGGAGGTALGTVVGTIGGIGAAFDVDVDEGSCAGLGFDMAVIDARFEGNSVHPFWTCDGIGKAVSDTVRPFLVAGLWLGALGTSAWGIAGAFGWRI